MGRNTELRRVVREIERKYETPSGAALPALSGLPGTAGEPVVDTFELSALYYDTADHRLLDNGITLRRREGGDDAGWHLKLPVRPGVRNELQFPESAGPEEVPTELTDLLVAVTRGRPLTPTALITTDRERHTLRDHSGKALVEVVSDLVVAAVSDGAGQESENVWREIEVEQISKAPELADALEERLFAAGMTRSVHPSKLRRAVGGSSHGTPKYPSAAADPRAALASYLEAHTRALLLADVDVRRGTSDGVHDLRVAARRLRSALQVYGDAFAPGDLVDKTVTDLRWVGRRLGEIRDLEVQSARLNAHLDATEAPPDPEALRTIARTYFAKATDAAEQVASETMSSRRYLDALDSLDALTSAYADTIDTDGRKAARKKATASFGHLISAVDHRVRAATKTSDPERRSTRMHSTRKAVKRLRYALEVVAQSRPKRAERALRRYKDLQELLGEHQDSVVARDHLLAILEEPACTAAAGFGLGLLHAREASTDITDTAHLRRAWKKARKATHAGLK